MKKRTKIIMGLTVGILLITVIVTTAVLITSGSDRRSYQRHMDLAQRYMDELQYEQAIAEYEAAIGIEPNNAEVYQALADAYIAMGDYESALDALERGTAQIGSEELETCKSDVESIVQASLTTEPDEGDRTYDGGNFETAENNSASGEDDDVVSDMTEETNIPEGDIEPDIDTQDTSGAVTIMVTWDGTYDDGSLMELDVNLTGRTDDGAAFLPVYVEENAGTEQLVFEGTLVGEMETAITETQGSVRITLYHTDGFYNLEVVDGVGYMLYNTNGLSGSDVSIAVVDAEGKSTQLSVEEGMCRSYTGLWFFGTGIDHGMLADYDGSWME